MAVTLLPDTLERMERAVAFARERLLRSTAALEGVGVAYAVAGGSAAAHWVATADEGGVRTAPRVEAVVRRGDLGAATAALLDAGFVALPGDGPAEFADAAPPRPRQGVRLLVAGERSRDGQPEPCPDPSDSVAGPHFRILTLDALVRLSLSTFAPDDRVDLDDLIAVGLVDRMWPARLPPTLGGRLQSMLDDPDR